MKNIQGWDADRALSRIQELEHLPGALLPILHALQEEFGYIDKAAIPLVAERAQSFPMPKCTESSASITIFAAPRADATF